MPERLKVNGNASLDARTELSRLNDRVTTVAQVFNDSMSSLRNDIKRLDDRLHELLEEGMVAKLNERVVKLEDQTGAFSKCSGEIHTIQIEVMRIDQRTKLLLYVGGALFAPLTAWGIIQLASRVIAP